jgi:hypothetical protein
MLRQMVLLEQQRSLSQALVLTKHQHEQPREMLMKELVE